MKTTATAAALALIALGGSGLAQACAAPGPAAPAAPRTTTLPGLFPAVYRPDAAAPGGFISVHDEGDFRTSIVGLWKFEMLAKSTRTNTNPMPDGVVIDFGTTAWHSDGTELMNSGIRNPADNDICQGTWEQVGPSTFALNHFALAWTGGSYTGPVNIRERVTVDPSGRRFTGTFTIVAYLATVTAGHEFDLTTPLASITGTLTGSRITVD